VRHYHAVVSAGARIFDEIHEAEIHVLLHVAVKQREPGIVCDKIHFTSLGAPGHHHILDDAGGRLAIELDQFETVPVQVHRVHVCRCHC